MSGDPDTERAAVKTYVPAYQKSEWQAHAERLGMTQSEFVRTMVQAGRTEFDVDPAEPRTSDGDPRGQALEDRVLEILSTAGPQSWEELSSAVTEAIGDDLDDALTALQEANRITHSGRAGGYTLAGDPE